MHENELISFEWAMRHLLRDKANLGIIESLVGVVLGVPLKTIRILEEGNDRESLENKHKRLNMLVEDEHGAQFIVVVKNETEQAFYEYVIFRISKLITDFINRGEGYGNVKKVFSINIVYFNLGEGTDIVYHGKTEFRGIHDSSLLSISPFQRQVFDISETSNLYPEYFILKVNDFNRWSKVPLEQWIYFLSTGKIPADSTAPGLDEAREKLRTAKMTPAERKAYDNHVDNLVILRDTVGNAKAEGRFEGRQEGREEGREEASIKIARNLKTMGMDAQSIAKATGLSLEAIEEL